MKAPIYFAPDRFQVIQNEDSFDIYKDNSLWNRVKLPLQGHYQTKNLATVSQAYVMLQEQWKLTEEHFLRGLERVVANTSLMGRWQQVQLNPRVILDTGHNEHGLKLTMQQLKQYEYKKLYFVLGLVNDKEVQKILKLLPSKAHFYLCQARIPRALPIAQLEKSCHELSLNYQSFNSVADAYEAALKDAQADDMIFVGGSTFVVAEVLEML
jgi:dihydrofolate synthase/folylpolyglutamate synthase